MGEPNDWFNKQAQVSSGFANRPPKLIRNTFGGSIGGPIVKDRFFGFFTYEGQRRAESLQVTRVVPSADLRNGIIHYIDTGGNVVTLTPAQIASMDTGCVGAGTCPWGPGPNPNSLAVLQSYPLPNTDAVGDTLNFRGFTFSAPTPGRQNTFIGKLDLNVDQGGNHKIFVRGNLMDDHEVSETTSGSASFSDQQQFPGMPNNATRFNNSKGVAIGYTAILGTNLINSFRYAFTRIGTGVAGIGTQPRVTFRGLDDPVGFHRSSFASVPMNNLIDDVTLTKGKHTLQFGGNLRIINNNRLSNDINFFQSSSNPAWLASGGIAGTGGPLDPGNVASSFGNSYDQPLSALLGTLPEITSTYNQDKNGTVIPQGALIPRHFKGHEGEIYAQDSWRIKPNLTVTGGLRYT
jgi:hypothetical protein